ncbi:hypothetical protein TWF694_005446 [Orbilia ellipsospora]|uniref:Uncharacterized protein n=1 Tax=Orbilia ellipsospora TaxID=2528407 RepID=A0AAV9WUC3_9PEZI
MQLLSKILFVSLSGLAVAAPVEQPALPHGVEKIFISPPAGIDISKHQSPPSNFNVTEAKSINRFSGDGKLAKRDANAHVILYDNFYFGGESEELSLTPTGGAILVEWYGKMNDRTSSLKVGSDAYPGKKCHFSADYWYDNSGLHCSGVTLEATVFGGPSIQSVDVLGGDLNDKISCIWCEQVW